MMGVSSFWQTVIKGLVIIAAVVVDQAQRKLQQRVALMQVARRHEGLRKSCSSVMLSEAGWRSRRRAAHRAEFEERRSSSSFDSGAAPPAQDEGDETTRTASGPLSDQLILNEDRSMHVIVLGAGAIGTSIAYRLAARGAAVTVVDAERRGLRGFGQIGRLSRTRLVRRHAADATRPSQFRLACGSCGRARQRLGLPPHDDLWRRDGSNLAPGATRAAELGFARSATRRPPRIGRDDRASAAGRVYGRDDAGRAGSGRAPAARKRDGAAPAGRSDRRRGDRRRGSRRATRWSSPWAHGRCSPRNG